MNIEDNPLVEVAMQIVIHAGDAREKIFEGLKYAKKFEFDQAHYYIDEAKKLIVEAHKSQTDIIQSEAGGAEYEINLLFIHAQDTLMTIKSEIKLATEMVEMIEILENKLNEIKESVNNEGSV